MDLKKIDLYGKHNKLIELKKTSYDEVYDKCIKKIKLTADMGELLCIYEIPGFIFGNGYALVNIIECSEYIIGKFGTNNKHIRIQFIEPNMLFIDWRK